MKQNRNTRQPPKPTNEAVSNLMRKIRSKDTKPEMIVRKFLYSNGLRYKLHVKDLPGKPDIVLPKYKTVVLVQGCFWHFHDHCKSGHIPKTNSEWWTKKLYKNKENDFKNQTKLADDGWTVLIIWECELKKQVIQKSLLTLLNNIQQKKMVIGD